MGPARTAMPFALALASAGAGALDAPPLPALAGTPALSTPAAPTALLPLAQDRTVWSLEESDWTRYRELMQGPGATFYSSVDPVLVLGIYARDDAERRKYARLAAAREKARVDRELTFMRAYTDAFREQFPGLSAIDSTLADRVALPRRIALQSPIPARPRVAFLTRVGCSACDDAMKQLLRKHVAIDVYVEGASGDDAIRAWAQQIGVPPERVRARDITLNHHRGELARAGGGKTPSAPALFSMERGTYRAVALGNLK